jgi:hypothetical protein
MTDPVKLDASALVANILDGPSLPWTLERKRLVGGKVVSEFIPYRMQVLRAEDDIQSIKDAQDSAKKIGELQGYGDIYKESMAHQLLVRALRHNEPRERPDGTSYYPPVFTMVEQLRNSFTGLELATLMNAYEVTRATFDVLEGIEDRDSESWIARLSDPLKGPFHLHALDSRHWPALCLYLARLARDLYEELGRPLSSSEPSTGADPESSTPSTGASSEPPSASNTGSEETVTVPGDRQITREEAEAIVAKRKGKPNTE